MPESARERMGRESRRIKREEWESEESKTGKVRRVKQEGARESGQGENVGAEETPRESRMECGMECTLRQRMSDYEFSHCKI